MKCFALLFWLASIQICLAAPPQLFQQKEFTAATFAEAVYHFIDLGEEKAVQELLQLARTQADEKLDAHHSFKIHERIGWVCRVLFDPKDKEPIRAPAFGALRLPRYTMPLSNWPRYPVAQSSNTYFVLSEGYTVAGKVGNPANYIEYCQKNGDFRKTKIVVPTRAIAQEDAAALRKSKPWTEIKWKDSGENWYYIMHEEWAWKFIQKQADDIR